MRASGVGAALGIGRLGVLISSLLGAMLIGAGAMAYFGFIAGLMAVVAFALLAMTNHVAPVERKG
jgi:AAHS family 4-hydroxybenzoate transporter-like MFS transporter